MTVRSDLDQLIDWYEKHCAIAGRVLPVIAVAGTIRQFARKHWRGGPFTYRGCEIIPIGKSRKAKQEVAKKQTEI